MLEGRINEHGGEEQELTARQEIVDTFLFLHCLHNSSNQEVLIEVSDALRNVFFDELRGYKLLKVFGTSNRELFSLKFNSYVQKSEYTCYVKPRIYRIDRDRINMDYDNFKSKMEFLQLAGSVYCRLRLAK